MCFLIVVASAIIEVSLLFKTNTYSYKHKYIMSHLDSIHVLLMGNSHILDSMIPDSIGNGVFNAAISGRSYVYDNDLLKQYVPLLTNLETVIVPIDYFSFYFGRETNNPRDNQHQIDMNRTYKCMYYKYMNVKADFWYWPEIINSKMSLIPRFLKSSDQLRGGDSLGYSRQKLSNRINNWKVAALPALVNTNMPIDKRKAMELYNVYSSMASITMKKGVRLILISTPMYKTCQEDINKNVVVEKEVFVKKLQKEFSNVDYYDFTFDERFEEDDFIDSSHLSEHGAIKFSRIIKDLLSL